MVAHRFKTQPFLEFLHLCYQKDKIFPNENFKNLIHGCLTRDRSCQKRLYEIYGPTMMPLCLLYSRNREEAEEVLQDGFIQMYKCISQFKHNGSFEGWLRRIMINCALQKYRGKSNRLNMIPFLKNNSSFHLKIINWKD